MAKARTLILNTKVDVTGEDKLKGLGATFKKAFSPQNLAVGGIALAGALTAGLASAVKALIDIERLNAQTAAVIKSTGGVANVTQQGIEDLAESAEDLTTIEREVVQEGANMLLTFTNVRNEIGEGNDIFDQATEKALDLSVALGTDLTSANLLLGKALNDPVKGMTAMTRAGIQFTESQKEMIESLVATGDMLGAQKIILAELETQFGGSAEAFANTTAGRIQRFQNDIGDSFESIIVGATKVADFLGTEVDLWPFDDQAKIIEANAASMGVDMGNAYAAGVAAQVTAGKDSITTATDEGIVNPIIVALLGGKEEAERIAGELPGGIGDAMLARQFDLTSAVDELVRFMKESITPAQEMMQLQGFLASAELAEGLGSNDLAIREKSREMKEAAESRLLELGGAAFNYGFNFGAQYAAGIVNSLGIVSDAGRQLGGALSNQVRIESEPPDHSSPLYGHTKWGGNFVRGITGGILDELGTLRRAAGLMAGSLVPSFGGSIVASRVSSVSPQPLSGARGGDIHIHLTVEGDLKAEERTLPGTIRRGLYAAGFVG